MNTSLEKYGSSLIRRMNSLAGPNSINLTIGQVDLPPSERVKTAVSDAALDDSSYKYTPSRGKEELREQIAASHNDKYSTEYSKDNVLVTAGVSPGLEATLKATLGGEKQRVLSPEIGYPTYWIVPEMLGFSVERYKLDKNLNPDTEDLKDKMGSDSVVILNSPSNPTGSIFPEENVREVAQQARDKDSLIVSDEVYDEICFGDRKTQSPSTYAPERTMVLNSLSKSGLVPGMRIGWVIGQGNLLENIAKANQYTSSCVNSLAQEAAVAHFQEGENGLSQHLEANRETLFSNLQYAGVRINPQGGIYGWIDVSNYGDSQQVSERLLNEYDVVTVPGKAFGTKGDSYIRVSFGGKKSDVEEGSKRLANFFENENKSS